MDDIVPKSQRRKVSYLFLFHRGGSDFWMDVSELDNDGESLPDPRKAGSHLVKAYEKPLEHSAAPGQIYGFETDGNDRIYHFSKKNKGGTNPYICSWNNKDDVGALRAEHNAYEAERMAQKAMKDEKAKKYHLEDLSKLREVYRRLPAPIKAQMMAQIVVYMTQ